MTEPGVARRAPLSGAVKVATGILLSRSFGLLRTLAQIHFLGAHTRQADAFAQALRLPNFLQNLLGEGVLSASFIPAYSSLLAKGEKKRADALAGAMFSILALVTAGCVLAGVLAAPLIVLPFTLGFEPEDRAFVVTLVRIAFPGTGLLVLSAWCLAILNSHRRFLLSYSAPIVWNACIITALIVSGRAAGAELSDVAFWAVVGAFVGSGLQFLVQLPAVLRLATEMQFGGLRKLTDDVRGVFRRFVPALVSRGSVQIGGYIDTVLVGSITAAGAVSALYYAQTVFGLPISLFGMSVAAAELPDVSAVAGGAVDRDSDAAVQLRTRLGAAIQRTTFFVLPSAVGLLLLGHQLFLLLATDTSQFTANDAFATWIVAGGFALGMLPATTGRIISTSFFAMHDTRTPLQYATIRIVAGALVAVLLLYLPGLILAQPVFPEMPILSVAGISVAASLGYWIETTLLRREFERRLGTVIVSRGFMPRIFGCLLVASVATLVARPFMEGLPELYGTLGQVALFSISYLLLAHLAGVSAVAEFLKKRSQKSP